MVVSTVKNEWSCDVLRFRHALWSQVLLLKASSMRRGRILLKGLRAKMLSSHGEACLSRREEEALARKRSQLQNTNKRLQKSCLLGGDCRSMENR